MTRKRHHAVDRPCSAAGFRPPRGLPVAVGPVVRRRLGDVRRRLMLVARRTSGRSAGRIASRVYPVTRCRSTARQLDVSNTHGCLSRSVNAAVRLASYVETTASSENRLMILATMLGLACMEFGVSLGDRRGRSWAVDELIAMKRPRGYGNTAVQLVVDLHDLGERGGESADAGWPRCGRCTR